MRICLQCSAQLTANSWDCPDCGWSPDFRNDFPLLSPDLIDGFPDYPADEHDRLAKLETNSFWFLSRNNIIMHALNLYFHQARNLLEIGCGTGFVLSGISRSRPDMSLFGAEAYLSALKYAKNRVHKAEFAQMNVYRLPFVKEFDAIGAFDVLEHMDDDISALSEINKATKHGGGIILTVPQHPWLWSVLDDMAGHKRRYTRHELKSKVQNAGFEILYMTSFITLLLPLMLISRIGKNRPSKKSGPAHCELHLSKPLNTVLKSICSWEFFMIQKGFSLPLGGSLLCVARKREI